MIRGTILHLPLLCCSFAHSKGFSSHPGLHEQCQLQAFAALLACRYYWATGKVYEHSKLLISFAAKSSLFLPSLPLSWMISVDGTK